MDANYAAWVDEANAKRDNGPAFAWKDNDPSDAYTYEQVLEVASDLISDGENAEYLRGIAELIGDLYGRYDIELGLRREEVERELLNLKAERFA